MPSLSHPGARPLASIAASALSPTGRPAQPVPEASARTPEVVERDSSVRLSAKALTGAALDAGRDTTDAARQFMSRMTEALFGEAGKGASFVFDAMQLESAAGFSSSQIYASGPNGVTSSASMSLTESAHFVGAGQLTLADGKTYDFEVEVRYQAAATVSSTVSSTASSTASSNIDAAPQATPDMILTGKQLPAIKYPGGIEDLFKLLGRELSTEGGDPGKLTLRLMRLVDRAALLAPRLQEDAPARQVAANAYANAGQVDA